MSDQPDKVTLSSEHQQLEITPKILALLDEIRAVYPQKEVSLEEYNRILAEIDKLAIVPGGIPYFRQAAAALSQIYEGKIELRNPLDLIYSATHRSVFHPTMLEGEEGPKFLSLPVPGLSEGLTAFGAEGQIFANFVARAVGGKVELVDAGLAAPVEGTIDGNVVRGAKDYLTGEDALTHEQLSAGILKGGEIAAEAIKRNDSNLLVIGEIGLGNTVSASIVALTLLRYLGLAGNNDTLALTMTNGATPDPRMVDDRLQILRQNLPNLEEQLKSMHPLEALRKFGGAELAEMVGGYLAIANTPEVAVICDGYIATVALAVASIINPAVLTRVVGSGKSTQKTHERLLEALNIKTIIHNVGTGEGAMGLLAVPFVGMSAELSNLVRGYGEDENKVGLLGDLIGRASGFDIGTGEG